MAPKAKPKSFTATIAEGAKPGPIAVPFDPDEVWGPKSEHRVCGTIGEYGWRGSVHRTDSGFAISPGPAWWRDCDVPRESEVQVVLRPEGPQRDDLAPDFAAALEAEPVAGEFFDALAQFYTKAYLRYIDATKRSPELRAERIEEVVGLLKDGMKERHR
ncbi:MAG TPA: YdeI/OmpD-associated family protein [Acidimicrobiales bacterium]|nr:YdeI/OmpD-associated family protein [Acidimicrobiales bacterium]